MKLPAILCLLISSLSFSAIAAEEIPEDSGQETRFVTEELFIFLHAGPGREYRILGSVSAGSSLKILDRDSSQEFTKVIDPKDREGWVESQYLTNDPGKAEQILQLSDKLAQAQETIQALQDADQSEPLQAELDQANGQISTLQSQIKTLNQEKTAIEQTNSSQEHDIQMDWFLKGGLVVFGSIVLGVILANLPKRRRRQDEWL